MNEREFTDFWKKMSAKLRAEFGGCTIRRRGPKIPPERHYNASEGRMWMCGLFDEADHARDARLAEMGIL